MSWGDFSIFFFRNIGIYIFPCLVLSIFIYYILFKKHIVSILDPFSLAVIGSMFGFSIVVFLRVTNTISERYFFQFIFSQSAFFIGFFILNKIAKKEMKKYHMVPCSSRATIDNTFFYIFVVISLLYISSNIAIYTISGIPLFSDESRLEFMAVGGGTGIFGRIVAVFLPVTLYMTLHCMLTIRKNIVRKIYCRFVIIIIIIIAVFTGARAAILSIASIVFIFFYLNRYDYGTIYSKFQKNQIKIFMLVLVSVTILFFFQYGSNLEQAFISLLFRLISFGDVFFMAYPYDNIESLTGTNILIIFFGDLLRTIRVLPQELIPLGMGFELFSVVTGVSDELVGPNPRHNVFGYVQFGFFGSILFSLFCGMVLSIVRTKFLFSDVTATHDRKILIMLIYRAFIPIEADPPAVTVFITNIILFFPVILIMLFFMRNINCRKMTMG